MLKSLRARNTALLVGIVLVGQLLAVALLYVLAIRPQVERVGGIMARNISAVSLAIDALPSDKRRALIAQINAKGAVRILDGNREPPEDRAVPTLLELMFMRSFAKEMGGDDVIVWQGGRVGQLWVRIDMGGAPYWISYERPPGWTPNGALFASFVIAVTMALIAGILIQRRLAKPLRDLAAAADGTHHDALPAALPEDGPTELASVAGSFNAMRRRLADQENKRTHMLASISHDLRTPLAKIRLEMAMIPGIAAESEAMVTRQLDRLDAMLSQFLDYARGADNEAAVAFDIVALLQETINDLGIAAQMPDAMAVMVSAKPMGTRRAITNILRNAENYGAPPIEIGLSLKGQKVVVTIRDHGAGVSDTQLTQLQTPFFRTDEARSKASGSGLGFAIARDLAEAQGSSLMIRNAEDGGLIVEMTFKAGAPAA
jgi:two-component system, OmpR family, osmolarity sensor histidine kinase EnvZ